MSKFKLFLIRKKLGLSKKEFKQLQKNIAIITAILAALGLKLLIKKLIHKKRHCHCGCHHPHFQDKHHCKCGCEDKWIDAKLLKTKLFETLLNRLSKTNENLKNKEN